MSVDPVKKYQEELSRQESLEHRDVLLAIAVILKTKEGLDLFKYLFKNFDVTTLPEKGLEGVELHDRLGFLRAGNSIYKLACEADSRTAATILADTERRRYDELYHWHRLDNGLGRSDSESE